MNFESLEGFNNFANSWWPYIISFIISLILSIRLFMAGPKCPSNNRIDNKIVLITGATSGIGFEIARQLAERGGSIIIACRNEEKGKMVLNEIKHNVPDAKLDMKLLDVSLMNNIRQFVNNFKQSYDKIDILINNAAVINQPFEQTFEKFDITFATNYLGPFLLTHLLLPLLNKSDNGRIINVSASAHFTAAINANDLMKGCQSKFVFGQTKLALVLFTKQLAKLTKETNITVNAVSPGIVRGTNHFKSLDIEKSLMTRISIWPWKWLLLKTPKEGSQSIIYAAIDPTLTQVTGQYFSDCEIKETSSAAKEVTLLKQIYETSCSLSGLEYDYVQKAIS